MLRSGRELLLVFVILSYKLIFIVVVLNFYEVYLENMVNFDNGIEVFFIVRSMVIKEVNGEEEKWSF